MLSGVPSESVSVKIFLDLYSEDSAPLIQSTVDALSVADVSGNLFAVKSIMSSLYIFPSLWPFHVNMYLLL